ncbi:MAG: EI24 domain-containing protein [Myxococcales bacterium]|nr:EI24 domain-containing protein [Myxococcales bacterium]
MGAASEGGAIERAGASKSIGFLAGLRYPFRGARFVYFEHPGLARFWLPPILLVGAALVGVGWGTFTYHAAVMEMLWSEPTGEGFLAWLARGFHLVVRWSLPVLMLGAGVVVVALTTTILAAPFNDALSEAVERLQTGQAGTGMSLGKVVRDLGRTFRLEVGKLAIYVGIMLPLFIASFALPGVGSVLYAVVGGLLTALFFAVDYVDWPASRHDLPVRARARAALRNLRPMLGLGVGVWAFLYVPLLNLFFMPAAVAGGTLLFLDLNPQIADIKEESGDRSAGGKAEGE